MNAMKEACSRSRAERDKQKQRRDTVNESVEFFKYASAVILYDMFGFRGARINRFIGALVDLFVQYGDRYDGEYLLAGLCKQCEDRGIVFEKNI